MCESLDCLKRLLVGTQAVKAILVGSVQTRKLPQKLEVAEAWLGCALLSGKQNLQGMNLDI